MLTLTNNFVSQTDAISITQIDFDFDDAMTVDDKQHLMTTWEAIDEEDLVDEITTATGWCINSIDYRHILN